MFSSAFLALLLCAGPRISAPIGLVPDAPASAVANSLAIQAAYDVAAPGSGSATVLMPPGDYYIDREIFLDRNGVGLQGWGKGLTRLLATNGRDVLVLGIPRRPNVPSTTAGMTPDHLVDLDGTGWLKGVTSGPGQRYAFRTKSDHHLAQQGGPLDEFPAGQTSLTVDLGIDLTNLRNPGGSYAAGSSASLCGLTERGVPSPWEMVLGNDLYILKLRSDSGKTVQVTWGAIPAAPGFVRLTVQVDLVAGTVWTWVDDKRLPNNAKLPPDFKLFAANQHCPFGIGSNAMQANVVNDYFGGASDIGFAGLRVTLAPVYKDADSLARIDGKPVNDGRYFAMEPATKGLLWLADPPAQVSASRCATVLGAGYVKTSAYCLDNAAHGNPWSATGAGPVRGLSVVGRVPYGRAATVGYSLGTRFADCSLLGGRGGLASINFGATYPLTATDCDMAGTDSALYLYMASSARIERTYIPGGFRSAIRLVDSDATILGLTAPAWGVSDHYVRAVRSSFALEDAAFDNEDWTAGPRIAPIYMIPGGEYPVVGSVRRSTFAVYGAAPFAVLDEVAAPDKMPRIFGVSGCPDLLRGDLGSGQIKAVGPRWKVTKDW